MLTPSTHTATFKVLSFLRRHQTKTILDGIVYCNSLTLTAVCNQVPFATTTTTKKLTFTTIEFDDIGAGSSGIACEVIVDFGRQGALPLGAAGAVALRAFTPKGPARNKQVASSRTKNQPVSRGGMGSLITLRAAVHPVLRGHQLHTMIVLSLSVRCKCCVEGKWGITTIPVTNQEHCLCSEERRNTCTNKNAINAERTKL